MLYPEIDRRGTYFWQRHQAVPVDGSLLKIHSKLVVNNCYASTTYIAQNNFDAGRIFSFEQWNDALCWDTCRSVDAVILPFLYTQQRFRDGGKEGVAFLKLDFLDPITNKLDLYLIQECDISTLLAFSACWLDASLAP